MKVAVVGATGLVGSKMLQVLEERHFPVTELFPVASSRSWGKKVTFQGREWTVIGADEAIAKRPTVAIFSAGGSASGELAPKFAAVGCRVVDNSSYWRMDPTKKLVIPEINGDVLGPDDYIIANPNCSTIQMLMALAPLHKAYGIKRIVVSTYQSVSGSGAKGVNQLKAERAGGTGDFYPHPIDLNTLPHIDVFLDNGYTKEEMKMVNETHKILRDDSIAVTATTVRVPVWGGHSESVNVEFRKPFDLDEARPASSSRTTPRTRSIRCRASPRARTRSSWAASAATSPSRTASTSGASRTTSARAPPPTPSRSPSSSWRRASWPNNCHSERSEGI